MSGRNPTLQSTSEVVPTALIEHSANHGVKKRQWLGVVAGIEGVLVVVRAEVDGGLVVLVVTPAVTDVAIHPGVVEVVIALEQARDRGTTGAPRPRCGPAGRSPRRCRPASW